MKKCSNFAFSSIIDLRVEEIQQFVERKVYIQMNPPDYVYEKESSRVGLCSLVNSLIS